MCLAKHFSTNFSPCNTSCINPLPPSKSAQHLPCWLEFTNILRVQSLKETEMKVRNVWEQMKVYFITFKIMYLKLILLTGNQRFPALIPMIKTSSLCLRFNSKEQVRVYLNVWKIKLTWVCSGILIFFNLQGKKLVSKITQLDINGVKITAFNWGEGTTFG